MAAKHTDGVHGDQRKRTSLAGNLALGALAVLAGVAVCELLLRLIGVGYPVFVWTDPIVGVAHIPGAAGSRHYEGRPWIEINSDGMRGPEARLEAPPGTFRIALLGDSFMEAFEVPYPKTVGEVVERRLAELRGAPVEVLNFGVGGYGTAQELLTLKHKVWKYSPDLVLVAVTTGNDVSDNYRPLRRANDIPYYVYDGPDLVLDSSFLATRGYRQRTLWTRRLSWVVQHSRLFQLLNRVRHNWRKRERQEANAGGIPGDEVGLRDEVQLPPSTPEWREAWRVTEGILRLMHEECRKQGTPFALVTLTRGIQVTPLREKKQAFLEQIGAENLYYPERRLADLGRREGFPVLNLAPTMAEQAERQRVYFHQHRDTLGVGHWNEAGHEAAGALIAAWLAREFPGRATP